MVLGREKSTVRFQPGSCPSRKNKIATLPNRQKSDLRNIHRYIPRLHRQQTEQPPTSPLGTALKTLAETCCCQEGFYSPDRSAAQNELRSIINKCLTSLSRNMLGIQFLEPVHLQGFAHWQSHPERTAICFLPVHIPNLNIQPSNPGSVFISLPRRFPTNSSLNLNPTDLRNRYLPGKYLSSQRLFSLVMSIVIRILGLKSVPAERIHSSEIDGIISLDLLDSPGWTGEIVFCLVAGKSENAEKSETFYCRRPFYLSTSIPSFENDFTEATVVNDDERTSKTPRTNVSVQLSSRQSVHTKNSESCRKRGSDALSNASIQDVHSTTGTDDTDVYSLQGPLIELEPTNDVYRDITWFLCQPRSENKLVNCISITDGGIRLTTMLVVYRLLQHDWRLLPFSCYHVQAAMLHETDHVLDTSPRWQRNTLELCVRLLLRRFHYFVCIGYLPHFNSDNLDLWAYLPRKQLSLAKSALDRLISSDTALMSLVRRTGRFGCDVIGNSASDVLNSKVTSRHGLLSPIAP